MGVGQIVPQSKIHFKLKDQIWFTRTTNDTS